MSYDGMEYMIRTSMLGCNHFGYQSHLTEFNALCKPSSVGVGWIAPWFCMIFCVVCSIILMSAMIGLIISSMESLMEIKTAEIEIWKDVAEVAEAYEIHHHTVLLMLEMFELLDEEKHCHLTFLELQEMFEEAGIMEEPDQFAMFLNVDRDGSGQVEFPEFCELVSITGVVTERSALALQLKDEAAERLKKEIPPPQTHVIAHQSRKDDVSTASVRRMQSTEETLLQRSRVSSKRGAERKILRLHSKRSRQHTKDELMAHVLSSASGGSTEGKKQTRFGRGSNSDSHYEGSASYSLNAGVGSMNVRQFSSNSVEGSSGKSTSELHHVGPLKSFKASQGETALNQEDPNPDTVGPLPTHAKLTLKTKDLSSKSSKAPKFSPIEENKSHTFSMLQRMPSWISGKRVNPEEGGDGDGDGDGGGSDKVTLPPLWSSKVSTCINKVAADDTSGSTTALEEATTSDKGRSVTMALSPLESSDKAKPFPAI